MRGFFTSEHENDNSPPIGIAPCVGSKQKRVVGPSKKSPPRTGRRYLPQKNSAAYAFLITLYRAEKNVLKFMRKEELIDAAEASGLSRCSIRPEKGRGKQRHIASSGKEWYSGWSGMTTLIHHALVTKSESRPAEYKLSDEGRLTTLECLSRSGMPDSAKIPVIREESLATDDQDLEHLGIAAAG